MGIISIYQPTCMICIKYKLFIITGNVQGSHSKRMYVVACAATVTVPYSCVFKDNNEKVYYTCMYLYITLTIHYLF